MADLKLMEELERTLNFSYHSGGVLLVHPPHSMGWRLLPFAVCAQTDYPAYVELRDRMVRTPRGSAVFVRQSVEHHVGLAGNTAGYSRFSHMNFLIFGCIDVLTLFDVPVLIRGSAAERIGRINTDLAALFLPSLDVRQRIQRKALGFELLATLLEVSTESPSGAKAFDALQRLMPALTLIREQLDGAISLARLARAMHLSESRFHAVFKQITGFAPQHYVQRQRIQAAQQLLLETDAPIKEIAGRVGHRDVFHFSRLFKQRCGVSPRAYREGVRRSLTGGSNPGANLR